MAKVEFLLTGNLNGITIENVKSVKKEYHSLLENNRFPSPPESNHFYSMISYFKRKDESNPICIGPYKNITPFEAANRIASDLVIINGLLQLVDSHKEWQNAEFTLRLGITHIKDKGDFTIESKKNFYEGEAFNVAPSFLKAKLSKTLKKWKDNDNLKYIFVNEDAFVGVDGKELDDRIVKIKNWHL